MKSNLYCAEKYKDMYMQMAQVCASASKAERKKVGCVILLEDLTVLHGFNGQPSGHHTEVCEEGDVTCNSVLHAEQNALQKALERSVCTTNSVAFVTLSPCLNCAKLLVYAEVRKVYYANSYRCCSGIDYLVDCGVTVEEIK